MSSEKKVEVKPEGAGIHFGALISGQAQVKSSATTTSPGPSQQQGGGGYSSHGSRVVQYNHDHNVFYSHGTTTSFEKQQEDFLLQNMGPGGMPNLPNVRSALPSYRTRVRPFSPKTPVHNSLAAFEPSFGSTSHAAKPGGVNVNASPVDQQVPGTSHGGSGGGDSTYSYSHLEYPPRVKRARQLDLAAMDENNYLSGSQQSLQSTGNTNAGPKRGNYRCSKCGQLKKGHVCPYLKTKGGKGKGKGEERKALAAATVAGSRVGVASMDDRSLSGHSAHTHTMGPGDPRQMNYVTYSNGIGINPTLVGMPAPAVRHAHGGFMPSSTPVSQRLRGETSRGLSPGTPLNTNTHNTQAFLTPPRPAHFTFTIAQGTRIEYKSPRQLSGAESESARSSATMDEWLSRVFAQLDPVSLLSVAQVCSHWRKVASYVWNYVTDIKLEIDSVKSKLPKVVLGHAKKLESLRLHVKTSIDNQVIYELANVGSTSLLSLDITLEPKAKNLVTNSSLKVLIQKFPSLECLSMDRCPSISSLKLKSRKLTLINRCT